MKIIHTSDWHLGRTLYGRTRYDEFTSFLNWLIQTIEEEQVTTLIIAGDIFDTSTPSNQSQKLYYNFLIEASRTSCRHIVIVAGNHDSPTFLNAPKELLKVLNVYVVASMAEDPSEEVLVLYNSEQPEAIVCAVPYLRDKELRTAEAGESIESKNSKLVMGTKNHYEQVCKIAKQKQTELKKAGYMNVPIIATGHLFTAGGKTHSDDGVRELYVGSLGHIGKEIFPDVIDYLALGHLHIPQKVGGEAHMRYSGSPIPMGYNEANQEKSLVLVEFHNPHEEDSKKKEESCTSPSSISLKKIPCFQELVCIEGSLKEIAEKIDELKKQDSKAWLEVEYKGDAIVTDLQEKIEEQIFGSSMEIRRVKNKQMVEQVLEGKFQNENLEDIEPLDVFKRLLEKIATTDDDHTELIETYKEVIVTLAEEDKRAN